VAFCHTTRKPRKTSIDVLCVLGVVVLFSVVEGPCKRYHMRPWPGTYDRPLLPPGAADVCSPEEDRMKKTRGCTGRWQCTDIHNQNRPHAFPHASTTTPSADFVSPVTATGPVTGTLGPGGCSVPSVERIPTRCQYQPTLGCVFQVWQPAYGVSTWANGGLRRALGKFSRACSQNADHR
jgi:hypothetical protein